MVQLTIIYGLSLSNIPIYIFLLACLMIVLFNDCAELDISTTGDAKLCDFPLFILDCFIDKPRVTVKCEYCNENFDRIDSKIHQVKIRKIHR